MKRDSAAERLIRNALWAALATLPTLAPLGLAHADCKIGKMAEVPVTMIGLRPTIIAKINGVDTTFIVDSGAFYSSLSPAKAAELHLRLSPPPFELRLQGVGGATEAQVADVKELTIFNVKVPHVEFIVGGSEPGDGISGLLGQNFLRIADIEYDLANGAVRLMKPHGCEKVALSYWAKVGQPYSMVDIDWATPAEPHTTGVALLNGSKIKVVFDTGAATSFVSLRAAERAGIKVDQPNVTFAGYSHGIGSRSVKTWVARFDTFRIGDEEIRNARLRIGELGLSIGDMLVGADFFLSHRVYVASSQRKLYFTYNGGPVFNLDHSPLGARADAAAQATAGANSATGTNAAADAHTGAGPNAPSGPNTGSAPNGAAETSAGAATNPVAGATPAATEANQGPQSNSADLNEPKDAAGFSQRGTAFAARHDFAHAIADLTRACELDPNEPSYFFERGEARWHNAQPLLAAADFDQALTLKPDHIPSLVSRAELRLSANDSDGAIKDLDMAQQTAAKENNVRFFIGALYIRAGRFADAIAQYDLWIPAHHDDVRMADALSNRGWARALSGQNLDKAVSDANAAVRLRKEPLFLGRRAVAELRAGNADKAFADWNAVLAVQPKNAWALYGRGVSQLRKGKTAEGQADIATATKWDPRIVQVATRQGMTP